MIPEQTLLEFPLFGDNATKVEPDNNKKSNGWQQGDVVPAEWMNWEWYHASKGVADLNKGVSSMEKEINTVLASCGITPSATACDQLYCALLKIRDDAVARSYPVGTVYINAKCATLPDALQAIGTWCAIDGRFLRACSACIGCTGGNASVTLAVSNLPSHSHTQPSHCHSMKHCHGYTPSGTVACHSHTMAHCHTINHGHSITDPGHTHQIERGSGGTCTKPNAGNNWASSCYTSGSSYTGITVNSHTGYSGGSTASKTGDTQPDFTGTLANTADTFCCSSSCKTMALPNTGGAAPTTNATGCGCSFSILPPYRDVAMWYRDA